MSVKQDLVAKRNELDDINKKIKKVRDEVIVDNGDFDFMKSTTLTGKDARERLEEFRKMAAQQSALGEEVDNLVEAVKAFDTVDTQDTSTLPQPAPAKKGGSLGEMFVKSAAFAEAMKSGKYVGVSADFDIGMKTLIQESAGFAPESLRTGEVVPYAVEPVRFFNSLPKAGTTFASVVYMEQILRTNSAAAAAEAGELGESAMQWEEKSVTVQQIGTWVPITDQQLEDVSQMQDLVDTELRNMLIEKLDDYAINGSGSSPAPLGILNKTGILTQDAAGDQIPDVFYKAMTQVMATGKADPNMILINPLDWQTVRLMRTTDGVYIWGSPSEQGPARMWGLTVVPTTRIAQGTGVTGDFAKYAKYFEKRGVMVEISDSHSDYFIKGKKAIRATVRGCFRWSRAAAFCKATSLS